MYFMDDFNGYITEGLNAEKIQRIYNVPGNVPYMMRKHEGQCGTVEEAAYNVVAHVRADMAHYSGHERVVYTMTASIMYGTASTSTAAILASYVYKLCYYVPVAPPRLVDLAMCAYSPRHLERLVIKEHSSYPTASMAVCEDDVLTTLCVELPLNVLSSIKESKTHAFGETEPHMAFAAKTTAAYIDLSATTKKAKSVCIHRVYVGSTSIVAHVAFDYLY